VSYRSFLQVCRELDEARKKVELLREALAKFNTEYQHDPPELGDTKWVQMEWGGDYKPRIVIEQMPTDTPLRLGEAEVRHYGPE